MSSFDRRRLLLVTPAAVLAACGFTPVYAPGEAAGALQGRVEVAAPEDRNSFLLVQELETRLGRPTNPAYRLDLVLSTTDEGQAVTAAGDITRFSVVGRARYSLSDIATGAIVADGKAENFTGYSATGSTVETLAAERDANARLMRILAEQIVTSLYATADIPA